MLMPSLWVTSPDGALVALENEGYAKEKDFQKLLADNPAVLASALDSDGEASQWLLIAQELAIKASESDTGTWKLDHLFIASDATPVLVEVKRSSDPRARREVVAQMLDYAASFAAEWPADRIRSRRERRFEADQDTVRQTEMDTFLAAAGVDDEELFWTEVQTRIDAGKIRLLFVADQLSPALVRIIEYLNGQLSDAELLGVEVVRHAPATSSGPVAYQPVVRGRSTPAARRKGPAERRSREEFNQAVVTHLGQPVLAAVNALVTAAEGIGGFESRGTSEANPVLYVNFHTNGGAPVYWPFLLKPGGDKLIIRMLKLRTHTAFKDETVRDDLLARVAAATGSTIQGNTDGSPWVPLSVVAVPGVVDKLTDVLRWVTATADAKLDRPPATPER
jgi:hypothetical protein